jgi:hypothetical protein
VKLAIDHHHPIAMIGTYVKLIDALLRENPKPDAYIDRIHWL